MSREALLNRFECEYNYWINEYITEMNNALDEIKSKSKSKSKSKNELDNDNDNDNNSDNDNDNPQISYIKSKFNKNIADLDKLYKNTIKQIASIYDDYELTIGQLNIYKEINTDRFIIDKLNKKLGDFPDLSNINMKTIIHKTNLSHKCLWHKNVLYDEFYKRSIIFPLKYEDYKYMKIAIYHHDDYIVEIDDDIQYDIKFCIIKKENIIIFWKKLKNNVATNVLFINMTSGKVMRNEFIKSDCDINFMYCNNQVISLSLIIDTTTIHLKITGYYNSDINLCYDLSNIIYDDCMFYISSDNFYGDSRGLYLFYDKSIYFMGKLDNIKVKHNLKLNINIPKWYRIYRILHIDYEFYGLCIQQSHPYRFTHSYDDSKFVNSTVLLGLTDMYILFL